MGTTKSNLFTDRQNELANAAKVLAHPARIAILDYLLQSTSCINSDLVEELGLAQATISQHLRELKEIGLIKGNIEGTKMCYCIDAEKWKAIQQDFMNLFNTYESKEHCC